MCREIGRHFDCAVSTDEDLHTGLELFEGAHHAIAFQASAMRGARSAPRFALCALRYALCAPLFAFGCASFWDDVTSRDFSFSGMFTKPNPLLVLRDSSDGDKRAKALAALHEPKQHGGSDAEQDYRWTEQVFHGLLQSEWVARVGFPETAMM